MENYRTQHKISGEEQELECKKQELIKAELLIEQQKLELAQLENQLQDFEQIYEDKIASRYRKIDEIEDLIQERLLSQVDLVEEKQNNDELKQLYRKLAKEVHPDLAKSEEERAVRLELMVKANEAYSQLDKNKLGQVLEEWRKRPESIKGDDYASQISRLSLCLDLKKGLLNNLREEINSIRDADLNLLRQHVIKSDQEGRDLLKEMAEKLDNKISLLYQRLNDLQVH